MVSEERGPIVFGEVAEQEPLGRNDHGDAHDLPCVEVQPRRSQAKLAEVCTTDNEPLFRFHRWLANLHILNLEEIKTIPFVPQSQPFVERVIGTLRREYLDYLFFWNGRILSRSSAPTATIITSTVAIAP